MLSSISSFPFTHVVISFPDQRAADCATCRQGPLHKIRQQYPTCTVTATTDPWGSRVGSGGGTVAALDVLNCINTSNDDSGDDDATLQTVLILHAGGESSRCPTQMVLGKAWTSIPCRDRLLNPIELWLRQCQLLFQGIPAGSLVVVASDTLLHLPSGTTGSLTVDWDQHEDAVLGLAVPAPLETAKNHGVFVLEKEDQAAIVMDDDDVDANSVNTTVTTIAACREVWQKPSLERLASTTAGASFVKNQQASAWIDTGVIVWMPAAGAAVRRLSQSTLAACTAAGLERSWQASSSCQSMSLEEYARTAALKVDLYTHFLQALSLTSSTSSVNNDDVVDSVEQRRALYCQTHADLPEAVAADIFDSLAPFGLRVLACPQGHFLHLGTTRELQDWLVHGSSSSCRGSDGGSGDVDSNTTLESRRLALCRWMGPALGLTRRLQSMTVLGDTNRTTLDDVVYQSILVGSPSSRIGDGTVVEHSWYETEHSIEIGKDCLVSGLRNNNSQQQAERLHIPNGILFQMLPLADQKGAYVYMVLGMDDNIKKRESIYGKTMEDFLDWAGLSEDDLWGAECTSPRMLWNARLHPVATTESFPSLFSWLEHFDNSDASLQEWKRNPRLSLAEIRNQSDAATEFAYRYDLAATEVPNRIQRHLDDVVGKIVDRKHAPTDLQFVIDLYKTNGDIQEVVEVLHRLDNVIRDGLERRMYDICGRASMVASAFLDELASISPSGTKEEPTAFDSYNIILLPNSSDQDLRSAMDELVKFRDQGIEQTPSHAFLTCSLAMEQLAQTMTARCVCGSEGLTKLRRGQQKPLCNSWVIAAAPARIDLSGGWSDTPPICFEYGSSVTGVAVCVDNKKPLSCRCRVLPGSKGVYLRSELRDGASGKLLSTKETEVSSLTELNDYRDPLSDCALLKCAVMCLASAHTDNDLQSFLDEFCGIQGSNRLEIVVTSLLPHGSGLGTSSILGGCILAAVGKCIGIDLVSQGDPLFRDLIDSVLVLEQRLTTGGGFQDQVNGLVGGLKMVSSEPSQAPLLLSVEQLHIDPSVREQLNGSLLLAFTGKTRLAKNILQNVLRRWSKRKPEIVETIAQLVTGAKSSRDAILAGDLDALGTCMTAYWEQKKIMAGDESSGAEPAVVRDVLSVLHDKKLIRGASMCGAGGGGFMAVLTASGVSSEDLQATLQRELADQSPELNDLTWHTCIICDSGLTLKVLEQSDDTDISAFDLSWHDME
jgi:galactokinase/mevalonate kinase-like predicted kinase